MSACFTLHCGDCMDVLKTFADASVDSIVTDPPYHLTQASRGGHARTNNPDMPHGRHRIGDKGFMGKVWDGGDIAHRVEMWSECLRVLKPGGHLLAFSGPRTYHRMACAIEDAGFEVRDQIMWLYGSGFPKSMDVSKAIDKAGGKSVAWFGPWFRGWREANGVTQKAVASLFPSKTGGLTGCVANWELGLNMPTPEQFNLIRDTFRLPFDSIEAVEREVISRSENGIAGGSGRHAGEEKSYGFAAEFDITAPATDAARQWEGWGTALKPAHEPICVARKPLVGTVVANVEAFGTGALNIDACRIPGQAQPFGNRTEADGWRMHKRPEDWMPSDIGRWPANVIHDGSAEVLEAFPDAPGQMADVSYQDGARKTQNVYGAMNRGHEPSRDRVYADNGGANFAMKPGARRLDAGSAARFFYCAKASRADRNEGLGGSDTPAVETEATMRDRETADWRKRNGNFHPTVKPTDLMAYLCRLVTPPGGTVLDPFMGSGSTGKAAMRESFRFIGIDMTPEYVEIAKARIQFEADRVDQALIESTRQTDMFAEAS